MFIKVFVERSLVFADIHELGARCAHTSENKEVDADKQAERHYPLQQFADPRTAWQTLIFDPLAFQQLNQTLITHWIDNNFILF